MTARQFVNPFVPNTPFPYHLQTSENHKVFWCFQGTHCSQGALRANGLIKHSFIFIDAWCSLQTLQQFELFMNEGRKIAESWHLILKFSIKSYYDTQNFNIWGLLL